MSLTKRELLTRRAAMLRRSRKFFDELGFIEIQAPCLSSDNVVDAHIDPVIVRRESILLPAGAWNEGHIAETYYLQSSPEFAMKRLLGEGVGSMYCLGPVFRAGERSTRHNVEFTMLEWYDVGASMERAIEQTIDLFCVTTRMKLPRVVTYRDLFRETLGIDPIACDTSVLRREITRLDDASLHSLASSLGTDRDALLDVILTQRIEPMINGDVVLIRNYPLSQAALARRSDEDPETAERFELIVYGLELANGYGELLDADELVRRNKINNEKRIATGRQPLPVDSRLIDAMRCGMPECSGVALGFDRLVMLATETRDIADVLAFPIEFA